MEKYWIFEEICRRYDSKTPTYLHELETISKEQAENDPNLEYLKNVNSLGSKGSILREVNFLQKHKLIKRLEVKNEKTQRMILQLIPTKKGIEAWERVVKPLREGKDVELSESLLPYTHAAKVTEFELVFKPEPSIKVKLDPVPEAIFPGIRERLEDKRDTRPWLYAISTGKLRHEVQVQRILQNKGLLRLYYPSIAERLFSYLTDT